MKKKLLAFLLLLASIGGVHIASAYRRGYGYHRGGFGYAWPVLGGSFLGTAIAASAASGARDDVRDLRKDVREALKEVHSNFNKLADEVKQLRDEVMELKGERRARGG